MNDDPELAHPENWKWIGVALVGAVVLFGLAAWVRSLPQSDDNFPAIAALAVLIAGFGAAAFLRTWDPRAEGVPAVKQLLLNNQIDDSGLAAL